MMTVDEALNHAQNELESAFEKWLSDECPSGDCESVQRQWDKSFVHQELVDELQPVMALTWEVRRLREQWQYYQDFCKQNGFDGITSMAVAVDKLREENERLRKELAKLREQAPAGWVDADGDFYHGRNYPNVFPTAVPVYAAPVPAPAVPNEIGLGKGEFVIWPVKIGGVHGLAFVKTKDPKAVGTFHAEPEDGQIELGAGDSVIHFGNAESAAVLADRLQHVISLMNPANAAPVPVPHKGATHCNGCGMTWLDDGLNPLGCPYCKDTVPAPAVPELDPMTRLIVSDPKQLKPKKQEPAVPYGIDEEAANRIALAVYDCKHGINQEPLLYAINRILATEAHPLSAEGQRSLLQSAEVQAGDKWQLTPAPTHPADRNAGEVRHD